MNDEEWCKFLYGFPFRTEPWAHQWREFRDHRHDDGRALLWQMRTGKTKEVVDQACCLHAEGKIDGVLVVAPNGVHRNWIRKQFPLHAWGSSDWRGHAWSSTDFHGAKFRRLAHDESLAAVVAHRPGLAVLAINSEALDSKGVQQAVRAFFKVHKQVFGVFDEAHDFRTPGSHRTKLARGLRKRVAYSRILTGTVADNSPLHTYSQYELVRPQCLGFKTFDDFKGRFAVYTIERTKSGRSYPKLDSYKDLGHLRELIAPHSSVVLREDVDDMPELVPSEATFELTVDQARAYRELRDELILELKCGAEVTAVEGGARLIKLQQIASGFVKDETGETHDIVPDEQNPRLLILQRELEGWRGCKVIVWCAFRDDISKVRDMLKRMGRNTEHVEYYGLTPQADRDRAIDRFQMDDGVDLFLGQPRAGGQGLDLSAAEAIIWYSHTPDLIIRKQADERGTQVGGKSVAVVDCVASGTVDDYYLSILSNKRSVSDDLSGSGLRDHLIDVLKAMEV
jgi:hypothetical protein